MLAALTGLKIHQVVNGFKAAAGNQLRDKEPAWVIIGELHHPHLVRLNPSIISYSNKIGLVKVRLVNAAEILVKKQQHLLWKIC